MDHLFHLVDSVPSCSIEDMCRLPVASLFVCFWLVERSHCNGSLQDSMGELHSRFAISLYQTLTETENNSNLIVSPVSVSLSLGLLQLGARGNTLAQLEGTLGYNVNGRIHLFFFFFFLLHTGMKRQSLYSGGISCSSRCESEVAELLVALSAVGTRWCGAVLLLLLALQSTVVSGAIIPASTPTLISLTTPAAWPRGREVTVFNYKQKESWSCCCIHFHVCDVSHVVQGWKLMAVGTIQDTITSRLKRKCYINFTPV